MSYEAKIFIVNYTPRGLTPCKISHICRSEFKSKQKEFEGDLKIKFCGKRLYPTESVKYLGVKSDTNLSFQIMLMNFPLN